MRPPRTARSRLASWLRESGVPLIVMVWTFIAAMDLLENVIRVVRVGDPLTWAAVWWQMEDYSLHWALWALLTPLVFWLWRRIPVQMAGGFSRLFSHMGLSLVVAVGHLVAWMALTTAVNGAPGLPDGQGLLLVLQTSLTDNVFVYWGLLGLASAYSYWSRSRDQELQAARLSAELAEQRLRALRHQLRPHFFFNALHSVAAFIGVGRAQEARALIQRLAELFRLALELTDADLIPVGRELEFLRTYAAIEQERRQGLTVRFDVAGGISAGVLVPPLIAQPLLENAIQHAAPDPAGDLDVTVSVALDGRRLRLSVTDSGHSRHLPPFEPGTGLTNVRERLRIAYGEAAGLRLEPADPTGTRAVLEIPAELAGGGDGAPRRRLEHGPEEPATIRMA